MNAFDVRKVIRPIVLVLSVLIAICSRAFMELLQCRTVDA